MSDLPDPSSDELRAAITEVATGLESRIESIVADAVRAVFDEVPSYREVDAEFMVKDVERHARAGYALFFAMVKERRGVSREELEYLHSTIAWRAQRGFEIEPILHAYRIGYRVMWRTIVETAKSRERGEEIVVALAEAAFESMESISQTVAEIYFEESWTYQAAAESEERHLIETVIEGGRVPAAVGEDRARIVRTVENPNGFLVVTARVNGDEGHLARSLRRCSVAMKDLGDSIGTGSAFVPRPHEVVGIIGLTASGPAAASRAFVERHEALERSTRAKVSVGLSLRCEGPRDARRGADESRYAVGLCGTGKPAVALHLMPIVDHLTGAAPPMVRWLASMRLSRLREFDAANEGALRKTVDAYARCDLNATSAAKLLHCHVNTVHNRLSRIEDVTGLDPTKVDDLVELLLTLELAEGEPAGERQLSGPAPGH